MILKPFDEIKEYFCVGIRDNYIHNYLNIIFFSNVLRESEPFVTSFNNNIFKQTITSTMK